MHADPPRLSSLVCRLSLSVILASVYMAPFIALVKQRAARDRLYSAKANIQQVGYEISNMAATLKMTKTMQLSSSVMASCNKLIDTKAVTENARSLMKEMAKAGVIQEITDDMFDVMDGDGVEEAADEEVDKVMFGILQDMDMKSAPTGPLKKANAAAEQEEEEEEEDKEEIDIDDMQKRLAALS